MKKFKLLTSFMVTTACVVPTISTLTSCGNAALSELASELKDATIQTFMTICKKVHRNIWDEQEAFDYVVTTMQGLGYVNYAGRDYWSYVPEVRDTIREETGCTVLNHPNYGNIWYDIPATKGMEDAPKVILQSHMDSQMTFADDAAEENWEEKGINVTFDRDNDILHTDEKTSLGADGGMGMALLLTIAKFANRFPHGGIRLLFTAGESEATSKLNKYASGAQFLVNDQLNDGYEYERYETEAELPYLEPGSFKPFGDTANEFADIISISGLYNKTIYSSTGGIKEMCFSDEKLELNKETGDSKDINKILNGSKLYTITVDNLHGGKSSKDIDSGYANALQMLMKTLNISKDNLQIQIISASSQPGAYNIAKTATCTFASNLTLDELNASKEKVLNETKESCKAENWKEVKFEVAEASGTYKYGLSTTQSTNLINLINKLQFGATDWFDQEHKSVKTSYNHGKFVLDINQEGKAESKLQLYLVCRSNDPKKLDDWETTEVPSMLEEAFTCLYNDQPPVVQHTNTITNPAWAGTDPNKLIDLIAKGYKNVGITPKITSTHGWVEVGCLVKGYEEISPNTQMAVLGVEINNSQELSESVYTDSLNTLFKSLIYSFEHIKESV